ncbi:unnamed protein product [Acanthoscelides obtectus]|uniref:Helicase ARIP4 n=1 Tax=Acanthoscelides obtectus TaxID=200917 RepID=A0A9P0Q3S7_ACAOB|nr:unnamed protein product [Acanthoscelides obtectus]CAK1626960.1 Helicase ARIP4 [Acanthoscelides obtectus]
MDPVLSRLGGGVTIQRLEKPKNATQKDSAGMDKPSEKPKETLQNPDESEDEFPPIPNLKRNHELNLPSTVSVKKIKLDEPHLEKKPSEDMILNNFSETEISDYDTESDIDESGNELDDLAAHEVLNQKVLEKVAEESQMGKEDSDEDEGSNSDSFFEKLVEQAEVPASSSTSPPIQPKQEPEDDYEVDIKEKLKEMGEISFETVKKGEKPVKKTEAPTENEVVVTPAKKFGADGEELPANLPKGIALRRNIREVMDETKLDESTLAAQRQEAERLRRVQEQQRLLRELQRQAALERNQQKVMDMLKGGSAAHRFPKAGSSSRIGNTVLVKLPNGQTKPMTRLPKRPFELLRVPKSGAPYPHHPGYKGPRAMMQHPRPKGAELTPSVSIAPVSKKFMPPMQRHSDSDSEGEEMKKYMMDAQMRHGMKSEIPPGGRPPVQTIDISSDDDCVVVSEPECDNEEPDQDDPANSGMHTNDEFNQPDEQGRVLVNVGHPEEEPDVFVAPQISRIIKPHQIGGVRFLYDNVVESINRFGSSSGFGCILAHSMGLGKTLQIVTFSDVFLRYTPAKTILCIMPINTLQNWMAEYNMWLPIAENAPNSPLNAHGEVRPRNFNLHVLNDSHRTLIARAAVIREWRSNGGVLLIGYEQFRLLSLRKFPKSRSKKAMSMEEGPPEDTKNKMLFDEVQAALVSPGPDLVICDEGHRIKNSHASISQALKQMQTKRRVVLTGYPLQNNLMEYWCMVDFVRPNYLGTKTEFCNMFERPIMNGQCIDSTEADIKLMRYRAHVLHSLLLGFVQRRSHTVLQTALPQKEEYVLLIRMTPFQRMLYETFMNEVVRIQATPNPLKAFAVCLKIWNHPDVLYNFLKKRAGGEAVDIDLEEVGNVLVNKESKPAKRGPGKPRKTPAKGKNGKPAASVTPYNSQTDHPTPPPPAATGAQPTTTSTSGPLTSFANTITSQSSNNFANQTDSTFPNFADSSPYYEQEFDQNAQFPSTFPSANSNFNQNFQSPIHFNSDSESASQNQKSILNLDNQTTSTTTPNNLANLPSGISLTPLSSKPKESPSSSVSLTPLTNTTSNALASLQNMQNDSTYMEIGQIDKQENSFVQQTNQNKTFGGDMQTQANQQLPGFNNFDQNNFWNQDGCFEPNYFGIGNASNNSWIKKEDTSTKTNLVSPKSEASQESKPKINIISDIKLPPITNPGKRINIISDIKIEPKKEEPDVKSEIKTESNSDVMAVKDELKTEVKSEVKVEENPFMKMNPLQLKESKEDSGIPYDWAIDLLKNYVPGCIENSAKFEILFCIITESILLGDRLLLFSQSLITLDLIEQFLQARQVPGETVHWARNVSYYRLDGSTSALEREKLINEFNSNPKIHLFLVSTRAGSLGINLVGANRVVVLDASWNPCHDTQAVCRVYRYGQRKPCFVYRLVVDNCLEKKIYDRQINKQGMSDRVVDECNPDAHLTMKDVSTLCWDDKKDDGEPKDWSNVRDNYIDVVLQKVLEKHGLALNKEPFQHESLLVDRKEKQLSSQEKRLAKKGYEREKQAARQPAYSLLGGVRGGHRPVASVRPMQQGERPSRWIPAEHWQRQGMTAQEMTLPLDVVIPTNQPEKGNIVLKAGQKVLVLKSPKGVYMQLESGKIVAIKTAIKAKEKHDEGMMDPTKALKLPPLPILPPAIKATPHMGQKRNPVKPFTPGATKFGVQSVQKNVPNLVSRIKSITKKMESTAVGVKDAGNKKKAVDIGNEIAKSLRRDENMPNSSSDEEHPPTPSHPHHSPEKYKPATGGVHSASPSPSKAPPESPDDEIQKRISLLKKNISIQRVTNHQQPQQQAKATPSTTAGGSNVVPKQQVAPPAHQHHQQKIVPALSRHADVGREEDSSDESMRNSIEEEGAATAFQDTLDSITSAFHATGDDHFEDDEEDDVSETSELEAAGAEIVEEEEEPVAEMETAGGKHHDQNDVSDHSDDVTYVSEQGGYDTGGAGTQSHYQSAQQAGTTSEHQAAKVDGTGQEYQGYNYNYGYNVPYHGHPPPPQGYGYPAAQAAGGTGHQQPAPAYDMMNTYGGHPATAPAAATVPPPPPQYNYGAYGAYPHPQPPPQHYPPPPTATGYDYNATAPPPTQPMYAPHPPAYHQPYAPPPHPPHQYPQGGMYPPPPPSAAPTYAGDYQQYHHQQPGVAPQAQPQTQQQQQQYYQTT